jgi:very-short-patch-repair endonuclease
MSDKDLFDNFIMDKTLNYAANNLGIAQTTIRHHVKIMNSDQYIKRKNQYEDFIEGILKAHNVNYIRNDRSVLHGRELDFYMPEANLAIECNGIFWHSELMGKTRHYHLEKTKTCNAQGIQLIHLWDYQFDNNLPLIKSMIKSKLNLIRNKINARKTKISELSSLEYSQFMKDNHLQGSVNSSIRYGLIHDGQLVAAMSFGASRFKTNEYELLRFASLSNNVVIGGAGKLFSHFLKNSNVDKIISYADRDISVGSLYDKLGFQQIAITPPSYMYFQNRQVYNRLYFQKHKLADKLKIFDSSLDEWTNMVNNGYNRFWKTGGFKYEFIR